MDMLNAADDFKVCLCKNKTKKEIMDIIREQDIRDLDTLREKADAGNKCGACCEDLQQLIDMVHIGG